MSARVAGCAIFLLLTGMVSSALGEQPDERAGVVSAAPASAIEAIVFYIAAGAVVASSLGICISRNIVRMAVWLFFTLGSIAMMYFLLAATFLAAAQLIVYVGGTLVLLIFGVMLTSRAPWVRYEPGKLETLAAAVVAIALLVSITMILTQTPWGDTASVAPGASVEQIGRTLLSTYLVPFEAAGVLLMVVMVGAAHLARDVRR